MSPLAPGLHDGFEIGPAGLQGVEVGELHGPHEFAVPFELRVVAGDLGAAVEPYVALTVAMSFAAFSVYAGVINFVPLLTECGLSTASRRLHRRCV